MIRALLEVYSDDLIISSSQTTATGLSKVLENCFSSPGPGWRPQGGGRGSADRLVFILVYFRLTPSKRCRVCSSG